MAFKQEVDYTYYLRLAKRYKSKLNIRLFGFCLLPSSIHLIVQSPQARNVSHFMQRVSQAYSLYYNRKYERQGRLWHGRFRSTALYYDEDLFECIKYVEFIPVRLGLAHSPIEYPFSSCSFRILGYPPMQKTTAFSSG